MSGMRLIRFELKMPQHSCSFEPGQEFIVRGQTLEYRFTEESPQCFAQ